MTTYKIKNFANLLTNNFYINFNIKLTNFI